MDHVSLTQIGGKNAQEGFHRRRIYNVIEQDKYKVNVIIRVHIKAKPEPYCLQVSKMRRTKHKIITHISGHENGKTKKAIMARTT